MEPLPASLEAVVYAAGVTAYAEEVESIGAEIFIADDPATLWPDASR